MPAPTTDTIPDADGRVLTVRHLSPLEALDLIEIADKAAENTQWMMRATFAACIRAIDGVPVPFPRDRLEFRAMYQKAGLEGIQAVIEHFTPKPAVIEDVQAVAKAP